MAIALVGTIGAVSQGAASAAVTPAWGTSENRTANNLLVLWVSVTASSTLPAAPSGWLIGQQVSGASTSASIFYRVATGADTAPTVAAITSGIISARLGEYSGANSVVPLDKTGSATGTTTSPVTATASAADISIGSLLVSSVALNYSAAATKTLTQAFNNATATSVTNAATSTASHYAFAYGLSTAKTSADTASITYTTTNATSVAEALVSFTNNASPTVALNAPADTATVTTLTPQLTFTGTDADGDGVSYEAQLGTTSTLDPVLVHGYSETNSNGTMSLVSAGAIGQSFTATAGTLDSVKFYLNKVGSPSGSMTAKLYAHTGTFGSGGTPTGSALATSNSVDISTIKTTAALVGFTFTGSNKYTLVNGTNYFVVVGYSSGDGSNYLIVNNANLGSDAGNGTSTSDNVNWSTTGGFGAYDVPFYVYTSTVSIDEFSDVDPNFTDITSSTVTDPFTSGHQVGLDPVVTGTTYYFDGHTSVTDPQAVWNNDANAFDGNLTDFADTATGGASITTNYLDGQGTNAPTSGGSISSVRARIYYRDGANTTSMNAAIYTNGLGQLLGTVTGTDKSGVAKYSSYAVLTAPSGGWTWSALNTLEVKVWGVVTGVSTTNIFRVEILVISPPSGLTNGSTYYWRVRAKDPLGTNNYGNWTTTQSFTVSAASTSHNLSLLGVGA